MQALSPSNIKLPVIRSFEINGYALFPGSDGTGLSHEFLNGVSVIAGINGLGKTTLLNALLRLLIGPKDVLRENPSDVGSTSHQLIPWRTPWFFTNRVPDAAAAASISGRISFGDDVVYVTRRLSDLGIEQLLHGEQQLPPSHEEYERIVARLCGVDSFYDFHFLVRNLVFYLEDRRPLVWTDDGQFEIARILFVPGSEATEFGKLYDEIKSQDSRYRNLLTESNRLVKRLKDQRRAEGSQAANLNAIAALKDAFSGTQATVEHLETEIESSIERERHTSDEIRRAQLDLESAFRDYEGLQQAFFASAFPKTSETFHYVYAHLIADGGCLICGSDAPDKAQELKRLIAAGTCPVCGTPPDQQEGFVAPAAVAAERVDGAARSVEEKQRSIAGLTDTRQRLADNIERLLNERQRSLEAASEQRAKLAALGARLPGSDSAVTELESSVKVTQENLNKIHQSRTEYVARFRRMMEGASERIVTAHTEVRNHFQAYVRQFLAETCELNLRNRRRPIGESGQAHDFPGFDVLMTSGVFRDQPRPRESREDISESQKEFIDLAFRMALIRTAAGPDTGAMLVLETPEASLDSLFVYRAGDLLRRFAAAGGTSGNVLIASSNLNDANMIPALLGIDTDPNRASEVSSRVINLLTLAAPNAALLTQGDAYRQQYQKAITPNPSRLPESSGQ